MAASLFPAPDLAAWTARILEGVGVDPAHARTSGDVLVDANLAGIDTHGLARLKPYLGLIGAGHVNATPRHVWAEKAGAFTFDADRGLGQAAGRDVMTRAIEVARHRAIVGVTIARIGHLGALGHFTAMAADAGMVALLLQNGPPIMGPPGSRRPAIGNNPMAFSAPVAGGPPIVFDVATSEAAFGKVIEAARAGRPIPAGWALDPEGAPTTDASLAMRGTLLPAGAHKGIGLSMLIEVLAGGLTGMVPRNVRPEGQGMPAYFGAFLLVANPALLVGREAFDAHLQDWLSHYRGAGDGIRYPGEASAALRARRSREGVPIGEELLAELRAIGEAAGVPFPAPR